MSFYIVDDIQQGTDEWHEWRRGVIGASEASIIMGENRWKGRQQLIDEKLGLIEPFGGNSATREGQMLEAPARISLEKKYREKLDATIVQDKSCPFLAASLDAINEKRNKVYEIKCGYKTYEQVSITSQVPHYYVAQLQHILMITNLETIILGVFRPDEPLICLTVQRNESYIKELRSKEKKFIWELESRGHKIQDEFRGSYVGSTLNQGRKSNQNAKKKSEFILHKDLLKFWDGNNFLEGDEPGIYVLEGKDHYWDGEEWCLPENNGYYNLNGVDLYWDGTKWH